MSYDLFSDKSNNSNSSHWSGTSLNTTTISDSQDNYLSASDSSSSDPIDNLLLQYYHQEDTAATPTVAQNTVTINRTVYKILLTPKKPTSTAPHAKDTRRNLDHDAKISFTAKVKANQQPPFKIVNTSIDDPNKVKSIFSLQTQLEDCR